MVTWHFGRLALSITSITIALGGQTSGLVAAWPKSRRFLPKRAEQAKKAHQETPKIGVTSMGHHSTESQILDALLKPPIFVGLPPEGPRTPPGALFYAGLVCWHPERFGAHAAAQDTDVAN